MTSTQSHGSVMPGENVPTMAAVSDALTTRERSLSHAEMEKLLSDDRRAAMSIVGILLTIFLLGLVGYITIALLASLRPS